MSDMTGGDKDGKIDVRVSKQDLMVIKEIAHLRFLDGAFHMEQDTLSEYVRALIKRDASAAVEEIQSRRRV